MGLGQKVTYGEELGEVVSIDDGSISEKLYAPCFGTIVCANASFAKPYEYIMCVQPRM